MISQSCEVNATVVVFTMQMTAGFPTLKGFVSNGARAHPVNPHDCSEIWVTKNSTTVPVFLKMQAMQASLCLHSFPQILFHFIVMHTGVSVQLKFDSTHSMDCALDGSIASHNAQWSFSGVLETLGVDGLWFINFTCKSWTLLLLDPVIPSSDTQSCGENLDWLDSEVQSTNHAKQAFSHQVKCIVFDFSSCFSSCSLLLSVVHLHSSFQWSIFAILLNFWFWFCLSHCWSCPCSSAVGLGCHHTAHQVSLRECRQLGLGMLGKCCWQCIFDNFTNCFFNVITFHKFLWHFDKILAKKIFWLFFGSFRTIWFKISLQMQRIHHNFFPSNPLFLFPWRGWWVFKLTRDDTEIFWKATQSCTVQLCPMIFWTLVIIPQKSPPEVEFLLAPSGQCKCWFFSHTLASANRQCTGPCRCTPSSESRGNPFDDFFMMARKFQWTLSHQVKKIKNNNELTWQNVKSPLSLVCFCLLFLLCWSPTKFKDEVGMLFIALPRLEGITTFGTFFHPLSMAIHFQECFCCHCTLHPLSQWPWSHSDLDLTFGSCQQLWRENEFSSLVTGGWHLTLPSHRSRLLCTLCAIFGSAELEISSAHTAIGSACNECLSTSTLTNVSCAVVLLCT